MTIIFGTRKPKVLPRHQHFPQRGNVGSSRGLALDDEKVVPLAPEIRFLADQQNVLSLEMNDRRTCTKTTRSAVVNLLSAQRIKDFITGQLTFSFLLLHISVNDITRQKLIKQKNKHKLFKY